MPTVKVTNKSGQTITMGLRSDAMLGVLKRRQQRGILTSVEVVEGAGGDAASSLEDLRAEAESLGVEVDGRWGERKLTQVIQAAKVEAAKAEAEDDEDE